MKDRKEQYNSYLQEMTAYGETQKSLTDPEARLMRFNSKFDVGYNVQTAVDSGKHLIADFKVTDHPTDSGLLCEVSEGARELLGLETIEVVADKGYRKPEDLQECLKVRHSAVGLQSVNNLHIFFNILFWRQPHMLFEIPRK